MVKRITERKKQAMETQTRIVAAALPMFNERGVENVTIEEIAEAANCSPGNIYHYFRNKEHIALNNYKPFDYEYSQFIKHMESDSMYQGMSALEKYVEFLAYAMEVNIEKINTVKNLYIYSLRYPEEGVLRINQGRDIYFIYHNMLEAIAKEEQLSFSDADYDKFSKQITIINRGLLVEWVISEQSFDINQQIRELSTIYLKGLIASFKQ